MRKNLFLFWIAISTIFASLCLILYPTRTMLNEDYCAFCDPKVLSYQKFYEDELVIALYTHKPILPGHSLIIPKRHVERFEGLSDEEITQIGRVIKKVNKAAEEVFETSPYLILQKNGKEAGQTVPHVHFHYVPRRVGDDSTLMFLIKMYTANLGSPISHSEMQEIAGKMRIAIAENGPK